MAQSSLNLGNIVCSIDLILNGSNYNMWAKAFLGRLQLWGYVSSESFPLKPKDGEIENDFASRLENWNSVHCPSLSTL